MPQYRFLIADEFDEDAELYGGRENGTREKVIEAENSREALEKAERYAESASNEHRHVEVRSYVQQCKSGK